MIGIDMTLAYVPYILQKENNKNKPQFKKENKQQNKPRIQASKPNVLTASELAVLRR